MKSLITILFLLAGFQSFAVPTFNKLVELNKCWLQQKDVDRSMLAADMQLSEQNWIRLHLTHVERTLRSRPTDGLTEIQKQNRLSALDHLHEYMLAGAFPQNEDYANRTPIFIDKHDNFCAVGYLVKVTGYEQVSRMIAAKTNLAYVREMNYPELFAWADEYGFTVDELAWIQPTYGPPPSTALVMAQGTDGPVRELFVGTGDKLYVGGSFANVAGNVSANNIAYLTEANNIDTWHTMGAGVNGTVEAITEFNGNIFVGGSFTTAGGVSANNIAYWDGMAWHNAGCLNGTVKDLVVFNGTLYASGNFSICPATSLSNFASWNGTAWQAIPGLTGTVNTMEVVNNSLYLGGNFSYNSTQVNIIQWTNGSGFQPVGNSLDNEVMDIISYHNVVYASCRQTGSNPELCLKLLSNTWTPVVYSAQFSSTGVKSFNTLCDYNDSLILGGDFYLSPVMMGYTIHYNMCISASGLYQNFYLNGPINKMTTFKGSLISGGNFTGHIVRKFAAGALCSPPPITFNNITDTSVYIHWPVWGGQYNYEYALTFSATPPSSGNTTTNVFQYFSNLIPATTYYIHVRKNCIAPPYITGWATDSFTTLPTPPPPVPCTQPDTVKITNITAHSADVAWIKNGSPAMYQHDVTTSPTPPLAAPVTFSMGYKALSLQPATQYYLHLRTICYVGDTSQWSATPFMTEEATGINNPTEEMISVYPNPVKDRLMINLQANATGELIISDITGKELIREKVNEENMHLDVVHLQSGIYLLQYRNSTGTQTLRVVKE